MKTGRNDPCPCGSGKKYKKCCLISTHIEKGREDSIRGKLVQDLLRFFKRHYSDRLDDALSFFWEDFDPEKYLDEGALGLSDINFWEWVVFDYPVDEENDKMLIDFYIEKNRDVSADELRILTMMKNSIISLYEVREVFPGKGLLLNDLLLGGEYDVIEKAATRNLRKWDIFAARLQLVDGAYIMSGAVYPYNLKMKDRILGFIREAFEDYRSDWPDATLDEFLKWNSELFNFFWYDVVQNPPPLKFATTSGEPFLLSRAVFEIKDKQAVDSGLKKIKGFEQDNADFVWLDNRNEDGSATVLGNIEIKDNSLVLSCNSKKRLEDGKKLIIDQMSGLLVHKADTFQEPMQAIKSLKDTSFDEREIKIPMETQQQIYTQFMQKHSEKWLNEKVPALGGETPMQAVKTEEGKRKVAELLKSFENSEEHNKREGKPFYDLSWMWDRLGLAREE